MDDARQDEQVLLGFGDMGAAHMQQRIVAAVPALAVATAEEGMEVHTSIMIVSFRFALLRFVVSVAKAWALTPLLSCPRSDFDVALKEGVREEVSL